MKKMTLQDLIDLFPRYEHTPFRPTSATRKGFAHKVKPCWKPARPQMTPAQWHKAQRKAKRTK